MSNIFGGKGAFRFVIRKLIYPLLKTTDAKRYQIEARRKCGLAATPELGGEDGSSIIEPRKKSNEEGAEVILR